MLGQLEVLRYVYSTTKQWVDRTAVPLLYLIKRHLIAGFFMRLGLGAAGREVKARRRMERVSSFRRDWNSSEEHLCVRSFLPTSHSRFCPAVFSPRNPHTLILFARLWRSEFWRSANYRPFATTGRVLTADYCPICLRKVLGCSLKPFCFVRAASQSTNLIAFN